MIETKINFQQVQDRVTAARSLQEAGQDNDAKSVLLKLADDIKKNDPGGEMKAPRIIRIGKKVIPVFARSIPDKPDKPQVEEPHPKTTNPKRPNRNASYNESYRYE